MGKRIAVFSSPWSGEHIGGILAGIKKKAIETKLDVYIFNCYSGYVGDDDFNEGETNILNLPKLERFDGVLLILNSVNSMSSVPHLIEEAKRCGIPCISIDQELEGEQFIGTNNYKAMAAMVEHLITEHHCREINFVGGPRDHGENSQRRQGYIDTLTRYGIPVEERRIVNLSFLRSDGLRAYQAFEAEGVEHPDAVVCANDEMASGYIEALKEHGYKVPEDVCVTGFDYSPLAQNYYPEIASVERSCENLGYAAIACILDLIDGKDVPKKVYASHRIRPNTSCGCYGRPEEYARLRLRVLDKQRWMDQSRWNINIMQRNMLVCETEVEFRKAMNMSRGMFHIENICVLVNEKTYEKEFDFNRDEKDAKSYPERMRLLYWTQRSETMGLEWVNTEDICPEEFAKGDGAHIYLIVPLHMNGITIGYGVIEDGIDNIIDGNLFYMVSVINTTIQNIRQSTYIRKINERLHRMYLLDAMTGAYNRFALKELGEPLLKSNMSVRRGTVFLFADMDGLKVFNDTYGHDMGDEAIKCLASIMMNSFSDDSFFCVRYGGDEFLVIGNCENEEQAGEMKQLIQDRIADFNREERMPRDLSASLGYVFASGEEQNPSIDYYISKADEMMYQIKKKKKESRRAFLGSEK